MQVDIRTTKWGKKCYLDGLLLEQRINTHLNIFEDFSLCGLEPLGKPIRILDRDRYVENVWADALHQSLRQAEILLVWFHPDLNESGLLAVLDLTLEADPAVIGDGVTRREVFQDYQRVRVTGYAPPILKKARTSNIFLS